MNQKTDLKLFSCEYFSKFSINVCPYTITGDTDWVIEKAKNHLINTHGCEDGEDLKEEILNSLLEN